MNTKTNPVAVLAIADLSVRQRVGQSLAALRWQVIEASGGAEALAKLEHAHSDLVIHDAWLPDLDVKEFVNEIESLHPATGLICMDGATQIIKQSRGVRRGEILYALRASQDWDGAAHLAPSAFSTRPLILSRDMLHSAADTQRHGDRQPGSDHASRTDAALVPHAMEAVTTSLPLHRQGAVVSLPEFIGTHPAMLEVSRRIRMVAPRRTSVLIQGPSGSGKELVARAIHRLSSRSTKPFVVLNCAAIPEALLEAELFGHTRGAFTGAVQGRVGRIEAADGGTLFLDEIGEMPLALQAKLLRFLESGEIQRVGDNTSVTVDVRVLSATHQALTLKARAGSFREDVYYRLAVFLIRTPSLKEHAEDIPVLAETLLRRLCETQPAKKLDASAMAALRAHFWPGNVRELAHVLERAYILSEGEISIRHHHIELEQEN